MDQRGSTKGKGCTKTVVKLSNEIKLTQRCVGRPQFNLEMEGMVKDVLLHSLVSLPFDYYNTRSGGTRKLPLSSSTIHTICTCACALSRVDERIFVLRSFSRRVVLIADSRRKLEARGVQC